jgi:putative phosphoesterase
MKIGVIADTHDDLGNLEQALATLRDEGVTTLLHCGDVCEPGTLAALAGFDVWLAQGNMDRLIGLASAVEEMFGRGRLAWLHCVSLDGYRLALIHGDNDEALGNLAASGEYAWVFHGHTHRRRDYQVGRTRVVNPGALGGMRRERRSFCILDLEAGEVRFVELP